MKAKRSMWALSRLWNKKSKKLSLTDAKFNQDNGDWFCKLYRKSRNLPNWKSSNVSILFVTQIGFSSLKIRSKQFRLLKIWKNYNWVGYAKKIFGLVISALWKSSNNLCLKGIIQTVSTSVKSSKYTNLPISPNWLSAVTNSLTQIAISMQKPHRQYRTCPVWPNSIWIRIVLAMRAVAH